MSQANVEIVEAFYAAFKQRDEAAMAEILNRDIEYRAAGDAQRR